MMPSFPMAGHLVQSCYSKLASCLAVAEALVGSKVKGKILMAREFCGSCYILFVESQDQGLPQRGFNMK